MDTLEGNIKFMYFMHQNIAEHNPFQDFHVFHVFHFSFFHGELGMADCGLTGSSEHSSVHFELTVNYIEITIKMTAIKRYGVCDR